MHATPRPDQLAEPTVLTSRAPAIPGLVAAPNLSTPPTPAPVILEGPSQKEFDDLKQAFADALKNAEDMKKKLDSSLPLSSTSGLPADSASAAALLKRAEAAEQQLADLEKQNAALKTKLESSVLQKKWETISPERAKECRREAMRRGSTPLNTSRLNIVGEGRSGKTAWLRSVSNQAFEDTASTIGVQSFLVVNKVDMEIKCEGGWSVVEGTFIMTADEAITRLAAEIAGTEAPQVCAYLPEAKCKDTRSLHFVTNLSSIMA